MYLRFQIYSISDPFKTVSLSLSLLRLPSSQPFPFSHFRIHHFRSTHCSIETSFFLIQPMAKNPSPLARFSVLLLLLLLISFEVNVAVASESPEIPPSPVPHSSSDSPSPSPAPVNNAPEPAPESSPLGSSSSPPAPVPTPENSPADSIPPPSPASSPSPAEAADDDGVGRSTGVKGGDGKSSGGMSSGEKAGIAVGVIAAAGVGVLGCMVYMKRRQNIQRSQYGYAARRELL